jgi:hypothetical protein
VSRGVLLLTIFAVACKGDPQRCDQAARNYATLKYWDRANAEIAKAPAEQREKLTRQRLAKFEDDLERGIDLVIAQCVSANNDEQVDCMINAKTYAEVRLCSKDD